MVVPIVSWLYSDISYFPRSDVTDFLESLAGEYGPQSSVGSGSTFLREIRFVNSMQVNSTVSCHSMYSFILSRNSVGNYCFAILPTDWLILVTSGLLPEIPFQFRTVLLKIDHKCITVCRNGMRCVFNHLHRQQEYCGLF